MPNTPPSKTSNKIVRSSLYIYIGIDRKRERISGELTAISLAQARGMLATQGISIIRLRKKNTLFSFRKKVKSQDITLFTRQMATMLMAGIPLVQALNVINETTPTSPLGELTRKIRLDIEGGNSFSVALKKNPDYFDHLFCNLVDSGEQSGTLETMLDRIATYKEKTDSLKRKIKKAMYYPIAVVMVAIAVTCILLIKVVPTFQELFASFGAKLPPFTQFILDISNALRAHGFSVFVGLAITIFCTLQWHKKSIRFQHFTQRLSLKLPIFGSIIRKTILARFSRTLATTSAAGVPLTDALDAVAKSCGNIIYTNAIYSIKEGISTGQQMRLSMKKTNVFPVMVVQMIGIGEEAGNLETMLAKVAGIYEEEVDAAVDGLTTLLEPLIMVFLGVIVGGLVIAMYLPIFKLGSVV
jgi:type IV pilus assembly protein PilC